jgi:hypothetical protein
MGSLEKDGLYEENLNGIDTLLDVFNPDAKQLLEQGSKRGQREI